MFATQLSNSRGIINLRRGLEMQMSELRGGSREFFVAGLAGMERRSKFGTVRSVTHSDYQRVRMVYFKRIKIIRETMIFSKNSSIYTRYSSETKLIIVNASINNRIEQGSCYYQNYR